MTLEEKYICQEHNLDFACIRCCTAYQERYNRLREFIKHVSIFIDTQNPHLAIKEANKVLEEIGEL